MIGSGGDRGAVTGWATAIGAVLAFGAGLFWIAHIGARPGVARWADQRHGLIFGLGLAVYCTSWTFFGAVGTAAAGGLAFLPIYLGPILLFTLGRPLVARVLAVGKAQQSTTIADFLAARYGKSPGVAALVTLIALAGAVPYMALQLKSVAQTLAVLAPDIRAQLDAPGTALAVAAAMAAFAMIFATGRLELTQHNRGLALTIAAEAVVKLLALGAVAVFAASLLVVRVDPAALAAAARSSFALDQLDLRFAVTTGLAAAAMLCLPRQFHMLVVEARDDRLTGAMVWLLPVYLALVCLAVVPVVLAGKALMPAGSPPDMWMIALPRHFGNDPLALFSFIGGFAASTGMMIVASIALSRMVTNDLIVPLLLRAGQPARQAAGVGRNLVLIRRLVVSGIIALAYGFAQNSRAGSLAALGEIAFAAAAQFAPALVIGLIWTRANRHGAAAGLVVGFALWLWLLALPALGLDVRPAAMAGDPLVWGSLSSLAANLAMLLLLSSLTRPSLPDRVQAAAFRSHRAAAPASARPATAPASRARIADLRLMLEQFVGPARSRDALNQLRLAHGRTYRDNEPLDAAVIGETEAIISTIIGSASARTLVQSALEGEPVAVEDIVLMFDKTAQKLQFGAELLQIAIENIDQGIAVVDKDQRLVAWNSRYGAMFDLPADLVQVGRPIADLIQFNMRALGWDETGIAAEVAKRLDHLRAGRRHSTERQLADGRVLRILGNAAPDGGYVTTYTDITADRQAELALEAKVAERTSQLSDANQALAAATRSKSRFLAAASHDLVQPMNAARLFASALREDLAHAGDQPPADAQRLLGQIDRSLASADQLLRALLDISRLDGGQWAVRPAPFPLDRLFADIANEFAIQAAARQIGLTVRPSGLWVNSDRGLLLSVLQNLVTNAIRYSDGGRVLVAARRRDDAVEIMVVDQGRGIAPEDQRRIFDEFVRLNPPGHNVPPGAPDAQPDPGLGLGLAIVQRIAALLGTSIDLASIPGRGSRFAVRLAAAMPVPVANIGTGDAAGTLAGMRILCIDNDPAGLAGLAALLGRWGCVVAAWPGPSGPPGADPAPPDALILDYRLDDGLTGDAAYAALRARWGRDVPTILLTAEANDATAAAAAAIGARRLLKPVGPASLRALLTGLGAGPGSLPPTRSAPQSDFQSDEAS